MGYWQKNVVKTTVVNTSASLVDKEGYAVGQDGVLTAANGDYVYGIVSAGMAQNVGSEVIVSGECEAYTLGSGGNIAVDSPLTGGPNGVLVLATLGTHLIRAIAKEANTGAAALHKIILY